MPTVKRTDQALAKLGAPQVSIGETKSELMFDVYLRGEHVPLVVIDHGSEFEIARVNAATGVLQYEETARDYPGLARKLIDAIQGLVAEGIAAAEEDE